MVKTAYFITTDSQQMRAILWPLWGYKVMAGLNILPFFSPPKNKGWLYHLLIYSSMTAVTEMESLPSSFPSLLYANTYTFILLLSLSLFSYCLTSFPALCLFLLFYNVLCPTLLCLFRGGENENLLAHYACDSINIIQWQDFFFHSIFFFHSKPSWICKSRSVQA